MTPRAPQRGGPGASIARSSACAAFDRREAVDGHECLRPLLAEDLDGRRVEAHALRPCLRLGQMHRRRRQVDHGPRHPEHLAPAQPGEQREGDDGHEQRREHGEEPPLLVFGQVADAARRLGEEPHARRWIARDPSVRDRPAEDRLEQADVVIRRGRRAALGAEGLAPVLDRLRGHGVHEQLAEGFLDPREPGLVRRVRALGAPRVLSVVGDQVADDHRFRPGRGLVELRTAGYAALPGLAAANLYIVAFAMSWGPVMWVLLGEMFPNRMRGAALAVSGATNWVTNFIVTVIFLPLLNAVGLAGAYALYALAAVCSLPFVWAAVRETRGKTLEQM
jgi:Sugar (and other) transporter